MPQTDTPDEIASMMAEAAEVDALLQRCAPLIQQMLATAHPRQVETREAAE